METNGIKCWYAPRDDTSEGAVVKAIKEASIFILVFTENSNASEQVQREVSNAFHFGCIIIPFKVDQTDANPSLSYYLTYMNWLDAMTPPLEDHLAKLCENVQKIKNGEKSEPSERKSTEGDLQQKKPLVSDTKPWWKRKWGLCFGSE